MEKQFNKRQFASKLTAKMLFYCIILLFGIISYILATSIKGAAYNYDPKNYYGTYEGASSKGWVCLEIYEDFALLDDSGETRYNYRYLSPTKVQEDYGKEDGRAGIFLYEDDPDYCILFWLYNVDGEIYLREEVSGLKLSCTYLRNN